MADERARWARIDALFDRALDLPPAERGAFLREACAGDAILEAEVHALLARMPEAEQALGDSAAAFAEGIVADTIDAELLDAEFARPSIGAEPPDPALGMGERLGSYRILERIGSGGMGEVYLAERDDGEFEQRVAIKRVKRGMDTDEILRRFRYERRILAGLVHPHIARLYDGGAGADGRPYLVMEYVEGLPITTSCDQARLGIADRIRRFCDVCAAVEYAHQKLVVHRDLKPGNILVTGDGTVKLLDFGIARLLAGDEPDAPRTRTGVPVLTPEYAAPEQARGEPVSTGSDVYALGAVLYELLAGARVRHTPEGAAVRPSTVAAPARPDPQTEGTRDRARVAALRATTAERLQRALRGDLDTIVLKALADEPERRYRSAEQLRADLQRYLRGEPVLARPDSRAYRVRKFVRRNRVAVGAAAAVLLSLVGGLGAALWQAELAGAARDRAEQERARAEQVSSFLLGLFDDADPLTNVASGADTLRVHHLLDRGAARLHGELAGQPLLRAQMLATLGRVYTSLAQFDRARPLLDSALALPATDGPALAERAATLVLLAALQKETAEYEAADATLTRVLALYERQEWPADSLYVRALSERGIVLGLLGRLDEAGALHQQALQLAERSADGSWLHTTALSNYAIHLYDLGEYARAEPLFRTVVQRARSRQGVHHPYLATNLNNLASSIHYQERLDEAEPHYREAIAIARRAFGADHPTVGLYLQNLATLHDDRRDFDAAAAVYRESLRIHETVLGRDNPSTAMLLRNLALNRHEARKYEEAETLLREAHASLAAALGAEHVYTALAAVSLGRTLVAREHAAEALPWIVSGKEHVDAQLPDGHWLRAVAQRDLGAALAATGELARAEPLLLESLETLRRERGESNYATTEARGQLVTLYERWNRPEDAARYRASTGS